MNKRQRWVLIVAGFAFGIGSCAYALLDRGTERSAILSFGAFVGALYLLAAGRR